MSKRKRGSKKYTPNTAQTVIAVNEYETINQELQKKISFLEQETIDQQVEFKKKINTVNLKYRLQVNKVGPFLKSEIERLKEASGRKYAEEIRQEYQNQDVASLLIEINELKEKHKQKLEEQKSQINNVSLKYRYQVNEVVPYLKKEIERLKFRTKQSETDFKNKIELLNHKVNAGNKKVISVRQTLSFQVGYQIVHAFKPWYNIFSLPLKLNEIFKLHKKNKQANKSIKKPSKIQQNIKAVTLEVGSTTYSKLSQTKAFDLTKLRMACVMDEFTFSSYSPESELLQLTPNNWEEEIKKFNPEVLFIESAWRGKDDLWGSKIGHNSQELQGIITWCNQQNVPTIFWNKEDPVHFETFLNTAKQFDYVFTTDIDCIHRYKGALGHNRVYLLPFATQPKVNNPIEKYERKDAFCFAGAYYVRYPERTRDLGNFVAYLPELKPLEIYDRNYGKDDVNYMFPDEYKPYIVGTLKHSEIDKAYKGYNYAINLNSIKQSQTMFARRIFELLASNTISVSNFSRGIRLLFGDLVFTSDSGEELLSRLKKINENEIDAKKLRLAALRKVMQEHTYEDRLAYIVSKLQDKGIAQLLPNIAVVVQVESKESLESILKQFQRQSYQYKTMYVVASKKLLKTCDTVENVTWVLETDAKKSKIKNIVKESWVAYITDKDYYGENYLLDMALATRYTQAEVIGKASYYTLESENDIVLQYPNNQYREVENLNVHSSMIQSKKLSDTTLLSWLKVQKESTFTLDNMFSIDEFNYCKNTVQTQKVQIIVDDLKGLNTGIDLDELVRRSENIEASINLDTDEPIMDAKVLSTLFRTPASKSVVFESDGIVFDVTSNLPDEKHEYIYARKDFTLDELGYTDTVKYYLDTAPGLNIQVVTFFIDAQGQKISHAINTANRNQEVEIPLGTEKVRFGLRIYAGGATVIKALVLGHRSITPAEVIGRSKHLILTNHYPSYEDLYRNGFVHSRVKAYQEDGIDVDVFRLRQNEIVNYHEFRDVDVITGSQKALENLLTSGQYKNILVHFLDEAMWEVLEKFVDTIEIIVWIHGAEIQPWYRRDFNYKNDDERNDAKKTSDIRMAFWRKILNPMPKNLQLVFVSQYFANEVMEDVKIELPKEQYQIIHNPISTSIFDYQEKNEEQRKKLLSIRPYASAKYANDLTVEAILLLSKKPWFNELEFKMIGDGALFDEILEPIKDFDNVSIERGFLTQSEIAQLHKEYGIFLTPTRMDAQGVSRDEAMSSGLVPVTNAVTAIPEFVDETCGILAPGDDAKAMAEGIERLYHNPDIFKEMSANAAARVRSQTSPEYTIAKEVLLITASKC